MGNVDLIYMNQYGLCTHHFFMFLKCNDLNFKFLVPRIPPPCGHFSDLRVESQYELYAALNASAQNPKIGIYLDNHFDRIIKQDFILVKTCLFKQIQGVVWKSYLEPSRQDLG